MKVLGVLAQKGGAGKTTLAVHLAVLAGAVLIDTDPQGSVSSWGKSRAKDDPPVLSCGVDELAGKLAALRQRKVHPWAVIDTPPHVEPSIRRVAELADYVIVPTRPGILDLRAIAQTTRIVKATHTPGMIVLNACPAPSTGGESAVVRDAREALSVLSLPVCSVALSQRAALSHALVLGEAVTEWEPAGKAATELRALWAILKEQVK